MEKTKRNNAGVPLKMMQRWRRPPVSCQFCRTKKLRCDRTQPCANCTVRKKECVYAKAPGLRERDPVQTPESPVHQASAAPSQSPLPNSEEIMARIRRLEDAVFEKNTQTARNTPQTTPRSDPSPFTQEPGLDELHPDTSFVQLVTSPFQVKDNSKLDIAQPTRFLPPRGHAFQLFEHFAHSVQLTFSILHLSSTRTLLDQTYNSIAAGETVESATLFHLFCIFAGAFLVATPQLLHKLSATREDSKAAFEGYTNLALMLLEKPLLPSTLALSGTMSLVHMLANADGYTDKVQLLRTRAVLMSRAMQIHRLDSAKSQERRRLTGFNPIEIEVQRRVWWYMVSTDWLLSFCGGPQEGTYLFHPAHMKVNYPRNVDDELLTSSGEQFDFPLSVPTSMSSFLFRCRLGEICREIVDAIPSVLIDPLDVDYDTVISLDAKLQNFLQSLPPFMQLDAASVRQTEETCRDRLYLPWQRLILHIGIYTRICRLHRPFHFAAATNPKYTFSRDACIKAAQVVLDLRRSMDDIDEYAGLNPLKIWTVMQHVFLAAITLATDVSLDPGAPYASVRKAEVLAACRLLEKSHQESNIAKEAIQRGVHTLMSMIQKHCPLEGSTRRSGLSSMPQDSLEGPNLGPTLTEQPLSGTPKTTGPDETLAVASTPYTGAQNLTITEDPNIADNLGEQDWDQLWSEFFDAAGEWDRPQWTTLMEGIDFNMGPALP